jgi:glycosyltransferase involved in cell wall biosynthesis
MTDPLVSVLVPTYNQAEWIKATLLSAVEQDCGALEVVVADDGSSDSSPGIIRELAAKFPERLIPVLGEANVGIPGNVNRGLAVCRGEYVAFLGGDDLFLPGKVNRQLAFMQARPDCGLSYHDLDVFHSATDRTLYIWSRRYGKRQGDARSLVRYGPYTGATSIMVRRKDIPARGCDVRIRIGCDWLLFVEILAASGGKIGYLDETLARYRRHERNVTSSWDWRLEDQLMTLAVIEARYPAYIAASRRRRADLLAMTAVRHAAARKPWLAARFFGESLVQSFPNPFSFLRLASREAAFWLRQGGKADDVMRGLFTPASRPDPSREPPPQRG